MVGECRPKKRCLLVQLLFAFFITLCFFDGTEASSRVYTRWGRNSCPTGDSLVYVGVAAGGGDAATGNGAGPQCIPKNVTYTSGGYNSQNTATADMFRIAYNTAGMGLDSMVRLNGDEMPCSVCKRASEAKKLLMIPARTSCPATMDVVYRGYLFATLDASYKSEFMCVDENAEGIGSSAVDTGMKVSPVEGSGGSDAVPNIDSYVEVTCVLCSTQNSSGSIYTRWGRNVCPATASLVYEGNMAGSTYNVNGGGVDSLCVSKTVEILENNPANNGGSKLVRAEYRTSTSGLMSGINNYEVPCAVCQNLQVANSHSMVVYARPDCPSGYQVDYAGYLMSGRFNNTRTQFSCVDSAAQGVGSAAAQNGKLMYFVETVSTFAGLTAYYEVTCAHCTVLASTQGSSYVRWGRTTCPTGQTLLYAGLGGGAYYTHTGSGYNLMCLHSTPKYLTYVSGSSSPGLLYRMEYQLTTTASVYEYRSLLDWDVPCAVCERAASKSNGMMVAGQASCGAFPGFTLEYSGYLVSSYYTHQKTEYICLDAAAQTTLSSANENGNLLYQVEWAETATSIEDNAKTYFELSCSVCSIGATDSTPAPPPPPPPATAAGQTFTRYGKNACPTNTNMVYKGIVVGGGSETGNGGNALCVPRNEIKYVEGNYSLQNSAGANLYRAQYITNGLGIASFFRLDKQEIPCVVCKTIVDTVATTVIGGRASCPASFDLLYRGYFFAPLETAYKSEYICIDEKAEGMGSSGSEGTYNLYPVEMAGSTHTISGYTAYLEVTCAVCASSQPSGSIYTRWGRKSCPNNATLIYDGWMAGSYYVLTSHTGGGAQSLCLARTGIEFLEKSTSNNAGSEIYRAKYYSSTLPAFASLNTLDIPCAVCQNSDSWGMYSQVMHGSTVCPTNTRTDYVGYLMSTAYTHSKSDFACIDKNMEAVASTSTATYGRLMYFAEIGAAFGAYTNYYEVTCAHCTSIPTQGSLYTRWGRSTCDAGSTLLYAGLGAGALSTHSGGGYNSLCMNPTPAYLSFNNTAATVGKIYRMEYQTTGASFYNFLGVNLYDVPCAICQRPVERSLALTVFGTQLCPSSYFPDYVGFMLADASGNAARHDYLCMDAKPEGTGSSASNGGAAMYPVELADTAVYIEDQLKTYLELPCTVCSGYRGGVVPSPPPPPPPLPVAAGETFVRWGRTALCPNNSVLVYAGVVAGGGNTLTGNGVDLMCVPQNGSFSPGNYDTTNQGSAEMYKAQYGTSGQGIASLVRLSSDEIPCVMCKRVLESTKSVTIPGRTTCPAGFNADYRGYLFASAETSYKTDYICVDEDAEGIGSSGNEGTILLYPVEVGASSIPVGYTANLEVTCVMCSSAAPSGSIYERWGRDVCPPSTTLLYEGMIGSSVYTALGGGHRHLCLPRSGVAYLESSTAVGGGSKIYRTEYETTSSAVNAAITALNNYEVPCAVCQNGPGSAYSFVSWASATCPVGFILDYAGYIMSQASTHQRGEYICVDQNMTAAVGSSSANENGHLLYFTEAASAFGNVTANYEVACAHCSSESSDVGSVYVRWGRNLCPASSNLLYAGNAAGGYYTQTGNGANTICLHPSPSYLQVNTAATATIAKIYRVEYETASASAFNLKAVSQYDVPCAVCQRPSTRSVPLEVMGASQCPAGFLNDYTGFVVSALSSQAGRQDYVCLDAQPEGTGSSASENGALFYMTEWSDTTASIIDNYKPYFEMSCVVCSACGGDSFLSGGSSSCSLATKCDSGTYESVAQTSSSDRLCLPCPAGSFMNLTAHTQKTCFGCPYNAIQPIAGQSKCKTCNAGFYRTTPTTQAACPAGSYCGGCIATLCEAGKYQSRTQQTSCIACSTTSYQNATGQLRCLPCSRGYYRQNATTQAKCEAGYYCAGSCKKVACPAGSYQPTLGSTSCITCPRPLYQNLAGQAACKTADVGYYRRSTTAETLCQKGYYCVGGYRYACNGVTQFQNLTGQTSCQNTILCQAGQYASRSPTRTSDRKCSSCRLGYSYQDLYNHTKTRCKTVSTCPRGKYEYTAPTLTSNRVCSSCNGVNLYQDVASSKTCKSVKLCQAGEYMARPPTPTTDRKCNLCIAGVNYNTVSNHTLTSCVAVSPICVAGKYQTSAPTRTTDRVCTDCGAGTYTDKPGQLSCTAFSPCKVGQYQSTAPTPSTNRACLYCNGVTEFQSQADQVSCNPTKSCISPEYIATLSTASTDRICGTCPTSCFTSDYLAGTCSGTNTTKCQPCNPKCASCTGPLANQCTSCLSSFTLTLGTCTSSCPNGQYNTGSSCVPCNTGCFQCKGSLSTDCVACSGSTYLSEGQCLSTCPQGTFARASTNDNRCVQCSACPAGSYASTVCSSSQDTVCSPASLCGVGQGEAVAPTLTSNRICQACNSTFEYQDQAGQVICKTATVCSAGQFVTKNATSTSDRQCKPCESGSYQFDENKGFCLGCKVGTYADTPGSYVCKDCGFGFYQGLVNQTSCSAILPGFYGIGGTEARRTGQAPCPKGFYCLGGGNDAIPCSGVTDYQPLTQQSSCVSATLCQAGQYEKTSATITTDRICATCPSNQWQDQVNHTEPLCQPFSDCDPGTYQASDLTPYADRNCTECDFGFFYQDKMNQKSCKALTVCKPGFQETTPPTTMSDRTCDMCEAGFTYSAGGDPCDSVTECILGQYVKAPPTLSTDRNCTTCDGIYEYQDQLGAAGCKKTTMCTAGTYESLYSSPSNDRICSPCDDGEFQSATNHSLSSCSIPIMCGAGQYQVQAPTITSDRVCNNCTLGVGWQNLTDHTITTCIAATICGAGKYVTKEATLSSDRQCLPCLADSTFQNKSGQAMCLNVTQICGIARGEVTAPTLSSDRVCGKCDGITQYQDEANSTMCKSTTVCDTDTPWEYVVKFPTVTSDRACANCTQASSCKSSEFLAGVCGGQDGVENTRCEKCHPSCATCEGPTSANCTSCLTKFTLLDGTCVPPCPTGQYKGATACVACDASCVECFQAGTSGCLSCNGSLFLSNYTCKSTCPSGQFKDNSTNECKPCSNCTGGSFFVETCTAESDTLCLPWTDCVPGELQVVAPSLTSDRQCTTVDGITEYTDEFNQVVAKPVSPPCQFPDAQTADASPSSDRLCTCDLDGCYDMLYSTVGSLLCRPLNENDPVDDMVADCCDGVPASTLVAALKKTSEYTSRHNCSGCAADGCYCTPGYIQVFDGEASSCVACDGLTEYNPVANSTYCRSVASCIPGSEQLVSPTISSDRVCELCPPGFTDDDLNGTTPCVECGLGGYTPIGSKFSCNASECTPAFADSDEDPSTPCAQCSLMKSFQGLTGQTSCNTVTECTEGEYEVSPPTLSSDRVCKACPVGVSFKTDSGHTSSCQSVTTCNAGQQEVTAPTSSSDRICQDCEYLATFKSIAGQSAVCQNLTQCAAGYEEISAPSLISDRKCRKCQPGVTFKAAAGQDSLCQPVTECAATQYISVLSTITSDRVCAPLTDCQAGVSFQLWGPTLYSDRTCSNCTVCPNGRFVLSDCTFYSDRQCMGCPECEDGVSFRNTPCSATSVSTCKPCRKCGPGYYQAHACTVTSDTDCQPVKICENGTEYQSVPATYTTDNTCVYRTLCDYDNQFQYVPGTFTTDRECEVITACDIGQEIAVDVSFTSDRVCRNCTAGTTDDDFAPSTPCTLCPAGTYAPVGSVGSCDNYLCEAGTADRDNDPSTPCQACDLGYNFSPTPGSPCLPIKNCSAGEELVGTPTVLSDSSCAPCIAGQTFKSQPGNLDKCASVKTACQSSEYQAAAPTTTNDRGCLSLTLCTPSLAFEFAAPTPTSDRQCSPASQCAASQYELKPLTSTSDRLCRNLTACYSSVEFESTAPTASSDRSCSPVTVCTSDEYAYVEATATSDRVCIPKDLTFLFFNGSFSALLSTQEEKDAFVDNLAAAAVANGLNDSSVLAVVLAPYSSVIVARVTTSSFDDLNALVYAGKLKVKGMTAAPCPFTQYLAAPIISGFPPECTPLTTCASGLQFELSAPNATANRVCQAYSTCGTGKVESAAPTSTSDRVCEDAASNDAASSSGSGGLDPLLLILILLGVLVLAVVGGIIYARHMRKKREESRRRELAMGSRPTTTSMTNPLYGLTDPIDRHGVVVNPMYAGAPTNNVDSNYETIPGGEDPLYGAPGGPLFGVGRLPGSTENDYDNMVPPGGHDTYLPGVVAGENPNYDNDPFGFDDPSYFPLVGINAPPLQESGYLQVDPNEP